MRFLAGLGSVLVRVWAFPTTLVGLVLACAALFGGRARMKVGVVEVWGGGLGWLLRAWPPSAAAIALGHVILAMTEDDLERHREHELVHVRQCERWGPLFLPAYAMASLWARARGHDPYRGNAFEREAFAADEARLAAGERGGAASSSADAASGPRSASGSRSG